MPQLHTRQFGPLEFDPGAILLFPGGLPAFPDQTQFVLVEQPSAAPVVFLQSLTDAELCFLAVPVGAVDPHYQLAVLAEDLCLLGLDQRRQPRIGEDVLCLAVLSAAENQPPTANLLAPVVVNLANRWAVQAVRADTRYSHQHSLNAGEVCS